MSTKKYNRLLQERYAILDEAERWKCADITSNQRMGLWSCSTYLDELLYIRHGIENEITECEIIFRLQFFKNLLNKLPADIIHLIASFGDIIDHSASKLLK